MKKLMTFFALISIIILTIPVNSYGWLTGFEGSDDPFLHHFYGHYLPSLRGSNLINEYGAYRNMPTGAYNYAQAQVYGWNQPYNYNYGWNQPYNYDYDDALDSYRADTYDSDDSDWRQNLPYNYGRPGTFSLWDYPPYSNPSYYIFGIEEPHLWQNRVPNPENVRIW